MRTKSLTGTSSVRSIPTCRGIALSFSLLIAPLTISGCHSAYINATIRNQSASTISVVQVEYPSASFGTQSIAPGQDFKYRFKVLGSGTVKIDYVDASQTEHKATGPSLSEGNEGTLLVVVNSDKPDWTLKLTPH